MKRIISLLLALVLVAAMLPVSAFAADPVASDSNGNNYDTLADAFNNALDGATITLLKDIAVTDETYKIGTETNQIRDLTFDLNGHTITATENATGNYQLFYIFGNLTVRDTVGSGGITLTATTDRDWGGLSAIFLNRGGVLDIYGGTFQHLGGTDMAYAVDNSANSYGDVVTTIYGGTLSSTYIGVRNYMDEHTGGQGEVSLYIKGGSISGVRLAVWGQIASSSASAPAKGTIEMSAGTLNGDLYIDDDLSGSALVPRDTSTTISGGVVNGDIQTKSDQLSITGGEFNGALGLYDDAANAATSADAVTGGTFTNFDPSDYVDDTSGKVAMVSEGGQGFKVGDIADTQAAVEDPAGGLTYYEDAADAFAASDEVLLNPVMPDGAEIVVPEGKDAYVGTVDPANKVEPGKYVADANGGLAHVHTPRVEWNMDAAAHWQCCSACGEICTEFGSHYDNNKDGRCDDCGWYLADSIGVGRQNPSTGVSFGLPCR